MELFKSIYLKSGDSQEFIDSVHTTLQNIDYGRINSHIEKIIKPYDFENSGLIHVLADDFQKDIWWGNKRMNGDNNGQ